MAISCPNPYSQDWKNLVNERGVKQATKDFIKNNYVIPSVVRKDMKPKLVAGKHVFNKDAVLQTLDQNPELSKEILDTMLERFPEVEINPEKIYDAEGNYVQLEPGDRGLHVRNGFHSAIAFSNQATIETIPHEFAHEWLQMFQNHPMVRKVVEKHGEENVAQAVGKYAATRMVSSWAENLINDINYLVRSIFGNVEVGEKLARAYYKGKNMGEVSEGLGYVSHHEKDSVFSGHKKTPEGGGYNPGGHIQREDVSGYYISDDQVKSDYKTFVIPKLKGGVDNSINYQEAKDYLAGYITLVRKSKEGLNKQSRPDVTDFNHVDLDSNLVSDLENFISDNRGAPKEGNIQMLLDFLEGKVSNELDKAARFELMKQARTLKAIHNAVGIYDVEVGFGKEAIIREGYQQVIAKKVFLEKNKVVDKEIITDLVLEEFDRKINSRDTFFKNLKDKIPDSLSFMKSWDLSRISPWLYDGYLLAKSLTGKTNSEFGDLFYTSLDHATNMFYKGQMNFRNITKVDSKYGNYSNWGVADKANAHIDSFETIEVKTDKGNIKLTMNEAATLFLNLSQEDTAYAIVNHGIYIGSGNKTGIKGRDLGFEGPIKLSTESLQEVLDVFNNNEKNQEFIKAVRRGMDAVYEEVNETYKQLIGQDLEKLDKFFPAYYGKESLDQRRELKTTEQFRSNHNRMGGNMPVRIGDAKMIMSNHSVAAGMYAAFTIPIRNNRMVLDGIKHKYKENKSISKRLDLVDGYLNNLEDPTMLYSSQGEKDMHRKVNEIMANFAVFTLGYNHFVTLKQTASYMAAKEFIPTEHLRKSGMGVGGLVIPKMAPFFQALKKVNKEEDLDSVRKLIHYEYRLDESNETYAEIIKNSDYLTWRFEGHVSRELSEALMSRTQGKDIIEWQIPGTKKTIKISKTRAMEGIRVMDAVTIMGIWNATKSWTDSQIANGELNVTPDSKEYWEHITNTAEFTIKRSQPTSDIINRSVLSGRRDPLSRAFTMFSSATQKLGQLMIMKVQDFNNDPSPESRAAMFKTMLNVMLMTSLYVTFIDLMKTMITTGFDDEEELASFTMWNTVNNMSGYFHGLGPVIRSATTRLDNQPWRSTMQHPVMMLVDDVGDAISQTAKGNFGKGIRETLDIMMKVKGVPGYPIRFGEKLID